MSKILFLKAREVLDSRGVPTVEAEVATRDGVFRAMVPEGASTGIHEAVELRDGGKRFLGRGVLKAVHNVDLIARKIKGMDTAGQAEIDEEMMRLDGTASKKRLGANAILAVSMAVCKAGAAAQGLQLYEHIGKIYGTKPSVLPMPMCNIVNGGKHAGQKNSIQEHMLVPTRAKRFSEALQMAAETYHTLKQILKKTYSPEETLLGDEGGFAPPQLKTLQDRLKIMLKAVKKAGYEGRMKIAVDAASSEFFYKGSYILEGKRYTAEKLISHYEKIAEEYPVFSLEDGLAEDDWESWAKLTARIGKKVQIVGDDLFVTNTERISKGIRLKAANAVLIKVNQIGTVTETLKAIRMAKKAGWQTIVSHRSGETEDSFIADLAVGTNAGQCKFGAPARSDRNAKYNQLLRIEEGLGGKGRFGWH